MSPLFTPGACKQALAHTFAAHMLPRMSQFRLLPAPREETIGGPGPAASAEAATERDPSLPAEGFELIADADGVRIRYSDDNALRYAQTTWAQIRSQCPDGPPGFRLSDWPDFPVRGVMLDVSRDRVPTRETLARLVQLFALLRINHFELYTEHTFAYPGHEVVWRDASPITAEDIVWLDALCTEHGIELSANQNCFGHMGRWLRHDDYRALADVPDGWRTKRGALMPAGVLSPTSESLDFARALLEELMPHFSSRRVNIGCDETFELGRGRSKARVDDLGRGRVYLEFLQELLKVVHASGREALFWGDVLRSHPELVAELPHKDTIALAWHYEAPLDLDTIPPAVLEGFSDFGISENFLRGFSGQVPAFADAGIPFWVCPGTSSWNSLVGRLPNARANLLDAAQVGLERGATGYLITDWGDNGHLQPPAVSIPPFAFGAAVSWCLESNREINLAALLDEFVFQDGRGKLGSALEEMGAAHTLSGLTSANASPLQAHLLPGTTLGTWGVADSASIDRVLQALEGASQSVAASAPSCSDGGIVKRELQQALRLARHGAWRIARDNDLACPSRSELQSDLREAIEAQRSCWLERSRPGGLSDSIGRLEKTLSEYDD